MIATGCHLRAGSGTFRSGLLLEAVFGGHVAAAVAVVGRLGRELTLIRTRGVSRVGTRRALARHLAAGRTVRSATLTGTDARRDLRGLLDRAEQQLRDVEDLEALLHLALLLLRRDGVGEHHDAEGAGGRDEVRLEADGLVHAFDVDLLADLFFHPHAVTAGAAAEAPLLVAVHLLRLQARDGGEHLARRGVDLVVTTQVARVVVGHETVDRVDRREPALRHQLAEQLRVVQYLVVAAEGRV